MTTREALESELMSYEYICPQCGQTVNPDVAYIACHHVYTMTCPVCQELLDEIDAPIADCDRQELVRC